MKATAAIFLIVLVAGATASVHIRPAQNKNIIEDAMELYRCLTESIAILQDNVNILVQTVTGLNGIIATINDMINACLAIGGENPSLIDQIQQATCLLNLVDQIRDLINQTIADVQNQVAQVIISGNNVLACMA